MNENDIIRSEDEFREKQAERDCIIRTCKIVCLSVLLAVTSVGTCCVADTYIKSQADMIK